MTLVHAGGSIEVSNVWKEYALAAHGPRTLKAAVVEAFRGRRTDRPRTWALQDISFRVEPGESFGIIGTNGSGKSTLLKLLTGISRPTQGTVKVSGSVSALLELGAGFHPDFSGRENTFLNGAILGLTRREIAERFDRIVSFAELEAHIDQPVKTYSSGMYMRLAFSIAVHVDPRILIIDEILAVGDAAFQKKCVERILGFRDEGRTIVFVSHSHGQVAQLCDRAAWIDRGILRAEGPCPEVLARYEAHLDGAEV